MRIDCHVHMGEESSFHIQEETLLTSIEKYGVDRILVSNINGMIKEPGTDLQNRVNREAIQFAEKYPKRVAVLLWARPEEEGAVPEFEEMLCKNRDVVRGIKVHPSISGIPITDPRIEAYAALGVKYGVPVLFHTALDKFSDPKQMEYLAEKYPKGQFILGHMGLRSDNEESIRLILTYPALYGDTAWVKPEQVLRIIREGGEDKILFGTDSPLGGGADIYADPVYYETYWKEFKTLVSKEQFEKLMYRNAWKLFWKEEEVSETI